MAAVALVVGIVALAGGGGEEEPDLSLEQLDEQGTGGSDVVTERPVEWVGGSNLRIGATLTLPAAQSPIAGVLIVPGFGAIDRNAVMGTRTPDASADRLSQDLNYSRPGIADNLLEDLNKALVDEGMAVLRYDKRGSGRSSLQPGQPMSYDDLVADAKGGLDFLALRKETQDKPIVIVGHDQGGLIAMRLAGYQGVHALVLASTFSRPLADVIGDDLLAARGPESGKVQSDQLHAVADQLKAGGSVPRPEDLNGNLRALLPALQEQYLRSVFSLDPLAEARAVKVPALVVRGSTDTTATAVDVDRLLAALPAGSEKQEVAGADHNLGTSGRRDSQAMAQIAAWVEAKVPRPGRR